MELGIFAKTFSRPTLEAALDAVVATGLPAMQFNLSLLGGPSLPPEVSAEEAGRVRTAVTARGLRMSAVSGTYNMAHPDAGERDDGGAGSRADRRRARRSGTSVVPLCTARATARTSGARLRTTPRRRA
jgi:sugar phosphate isomerase/epimerase